MTWHPKPCRRVHSTCATAWPAHTASTLSSCACPSSCDQRRDTFCVHESYTARDRPPSETVFVPSRVAVTTCAGMTHAKIRLGHPDSWVNTLATESLPRPGLPLAAHCSTLHASPLCACPHVTRRSFSALPTGPAVQACKHTRDITWLYAWTHLIALRAQRAQ